LIFPKLKAAGRNYIVKLRENTNKLHRLLMKLA
jgi:hypothetical protein